MTPARWYCDQGAIPGEPLYLLDVIPGSSPDYPSGLITVLDTDDGDIPSYQAVIPALPGFHDEQRSETFSEIEAAQDWVEARMHPPLQALPFEVSSEYWFRDCFTPPPGTIWIAITEPGAQPVTPQHPFAAMYHLELWDIPHTIEDTRHGRLNPMSTAQARDVLAFVQRYRPCARGVTISCHAGISRSPAVAIALSEWLPTLPGTEALISRYPGFNRQIYRTLTHTAQEEGLLLR